MAYYNLVAEYASLVILTIAMISFMLDQRKGTTRHTALLWLQIAALISILSTIGSLITTDYFMNYPVWVVDLFKHSYFLTASIIAPMGFFYGITLIYHKTYKINFLKNYVWAWLPYFLYCIFILTNHFHHLVFTISPTEGYIRGPFFRITYVIALIYFVLLIGFIIKNFNIPQRNNLLIILLSFVISTIIFLAQLIFPTVQLSGLASTVGVVIIQFYLQNTSHSTDSLTELYNRETLTAQMTKLCKQNKPFTLFVFSIRNFKGINERSGLKFGDALLEQIAIRFRKMHRQNLIFRYSGDQFALIFPEHNTQSNKIVNEIYYQVSSAYLVDNINTVLDFVWARVDFPEFGETPQELISSIDYSLSIIKKEDMSKSFYYDMSVCSKMKRRNYVIERIKHALDTDGFEAFYQPIYSVKESNFTLAEALIRFKPDQGDFISPAEFIPIAEDTGLIVRVTMMMLDIACDDYRRLRKFVGKDLQLQGISVNFPYQVFMRQGILDDVHDIVHKHGLLPEMIKIELTERTFATDTDATLKKINEFIERGFVFELDDFGVEYSNFSMFFNVPINIIKFDRSLVVSSTENIGRRDFFKKFLVAIKALRSDIEVVMEGVEDDEIKQFLIDCGCDYIQGYVFSKPLNFTEFHKFISK